MLRHELVNAWQYYDGFALHYEKMALEIAKQIDEVDKRLATYQDAERWIKTQTEEIPEKKPPRRFFEICGQ